MTKYVEFAKRSKKEQKKLNNEKRQTWIIKPTNRIVESKKLYKRSNNKKVLLELSYS